MLALAEGTLDGDARRAAEAHLDSCAGCLALVAELARATGAEPRPRPRASTATPSERYQLGPELARGGMGRIHEALDRTLGRHVAIKCALRATPGLAQRFEREVALTSRLEHPAIVPVHDAGTLPDGTPFYAMRLVVGRTLDRLIAEADSPERRLALVPSVIAVADAMAYAHSHRIVHRDLKPHNILIGEFGETVLLDWGLAKDLTEPEPPADEPGVDATDATDATMTAAGDVLGTRGYMAPEQAAGEPVGLAADVYGLGATLHHVLTGVVPRGLPLAPIGADTPPDLIAIVARATAEAPAARYPSARELAADLHRFQAGRLVEARRYSPAQLVARWLGRHRAAVAVGGVAVAVLAVVSVVALRRIVAEHDAAVAARSRAEQQRDAAEDVVGFVIGELRTQLEQLGRLDLLAGTGQRVSDYYQRLGHVGYAAALGHHLDAVQTLGEAQQAAGDGARAVETFGRELALARAGGADDRVCWALIRLGQAQRTVGAVEDSARSFRACAELARAARDQTSERWQHLLAASGIELARLAYGRRDLAGARALATEVAEIGRRAVAIDAAWGHHAIGLAAFHLAQWAMEEDDWAAARRSITEALAAEERHAAARPDDIDAQHAVAAALNVLGQIQEHDGEPAAERSYLAARDRFATLVAREPRNKARRRELSRAETQLGRLRSNLDDLRGALVHFEASRALIVALTEENPDNPDRARDLAVSDSDLAETLRQLGELPAARVAIDRSLAGFERVVALAPSELAGVRELSMAYDMRARFLAELRSDRAQERADRARAVELGRTVLAALDVPGVRLQQAQWLVALARVEPGRAAAALAEAHAVVAPVRDEIAKDPESRAFLTELDALARRGR